MEALQAVLEKTEAARLAWQKEMVAKAEADAAAAAERKAREEEEKKRKEEIADATKKAKETAEKKAEEAAKKAKDEADKKFKELEEAKAEAEKKRKELEEETAKLKPPDHAGKSIKFEDAMGRKFSFPFHLCKTWKGMEGLIRQAFSAIEDFGEHVKLGHYDLTGPDGEIILPQVWENMIQPDWEIKMHLWPGAVEEKEKKKKGKEKGGDPGLADPLANLGLGDLGMLGIPDPAKKPGKSSAPKKDGKKSSRSRDAHIVDVGGQLPPPPNFPPGVMPMDPFNMAFPELEKKTSKSSSSKTKKKDPGLMGWFAGSSAPRGSSKKDDEKPDPVRHHHHTTSAGKASRRSSSVYSHGSKGSKASKSHSKEAAVGCALM
jgi:chemotaxis protein histidine kinase CheA